MIDIQALQLIKLRIPSCWKCYIALLQPNLCTFHQRVVWRRNTSTAAWAIMLDGEVCTWQFYDSFLCASIIFGEGVNLHQERNAQFLVQRLWLLHLHDHRLQVLVVVISLLEDVSGFKEGRSEMTELKMHKLLKWQLYNINIYSFLQLRF